MKTTTAATYAHLQQAVQTLAVCWRVERRDGYALLGTEHDRNVEVTTSTAGLTGLYLATTGITGSSISSTPDMAVDNLEVQGLLDTETKVLGISADDIEAGLYDDATTTIFLVNWEDPDAGQLILRHGYIGEIKRASTGHYTTELRGMVQRLTQTVVGTMSDSCDARFGDARCGVDLNYWTDTGTVTTATSRRQFTATVGAASNVFEFYEPFPNLVQVGDTFAVSYGCNKSIEMCKGRFDNVINFRGYAVFTPLMSKQIGGPHRAKSVDRTVLEEEEIAIQRAIREHQASLEPDVPAEEKIPEYKNGFLTFTSGANATYGREVKVHTEV